MADHERIDPSAAQTKGGGLYRPLAVLRYLDRRQKTVMPPAVVGLPIPLLWSALALLAVAAVLLWLGTAPIVADESRSPRLVAVELPPGSPAIAVGDRVDVVVDDSGRRASLQVTAVVLDLDETTGSSPGLLIGWSSDRDLQLLVVPRALAIRLEAR
jgi:hypothetical protein